ncbi:MAG: ParA family protein [Eggerthellaceae bacterium]|nr:ParA family protein [Eggerthellaceae bacterium]
MSLEATDVIESPLTVIVGHYGSGKTNLVMNLALGVARKGKSVTVIDMDIVNPYFRVSEQRKALEAEGIELVAPVFSEMGTSLDVPSLTGRILPAIEDASENRVVIIDVGGDDAGSVALGRYARAIEAHGYGMFYVANRYRNLVQDLDDALENMAEIEAASRLHMTGIINNSHLQGATDAEVVEKGFEYVSELSRLSGLRVICTTVPRELGNLPFDKLYPVERYVKAPWE